MEIRVRSVLFIEMVLVFHKSMAQAGEMIGVHVCYALALLLSGGNRLLHFLADAIID